jgi:hypothetical protein
MCETSEMTLIVEAAHEMQNPNGYISRLWIDEQEIVTVGLTLRELFSHLEGQGWNLACMNVAPATDENRIAFSYSKPITTYLSITQIDFNFQARLLAESSVSKRRPLVYN